MNILIKKFTMTMFVCISLFLSITCANAIDNGSFKENNERQTRSYARETLSAEEYYEAGLKGELMRTEGKKKPLLLSELKLVRAKPSGVNEGGVYKDVNGSFWIVKQAQNPEYEYLGSKVMDLLIGPLSPEVELLPDAPGYTASKLLPGFVMKQDVMSDPNHKPIVGEADLLVAMDLIGLDDRHDQNQGYIDMGDRLESARVDFDSSFNFAYFDAIFRKFDAKASDSVVSIPDEMILYVLGDAYNDLWEAGVPLAYELYKDLGAQLMARKHELNLSFQFCKQYDLKSIGYIFYFFLFARVTMFPFGSFEK